MAARNTSNDIDAAAARARLSGIIEGIRAAGDAERLDKARSLFRSSVPLHLRAYVAAAMLLEALDREGSSGKRGGSERAARREDARKRGGDAVTGREPRRETPKSKGKRDEARQEPKAGRAPEEVLPEARIKEGRLSGEGVTLFVGMGRRQRLNARGLYRLMSDLTELEEDQVGEVRSRDNYSFVEVAPDLAETVMAALDGATVRGRKLTVSLARKKDERNGAPGSWGEGADASERRVAFVDAASDADVEGEDAATGDDGDGPADEDS
ncbi:MAG: DbpA RNA binding domain-containing protein [Spirochaetales bacterium]|nr:DbpA RNA binding domain-containing protein [Spirochaetales bacterium]